MASSLQKLVFKAKKFLKERNYEAAKDSATKIVELAPKDPNGYLIFGQAAMATESYLEVLMAVSEGLDQCGDDHSGLLQLYQEAQSARRYQELKIVRQNEALPALLPIKSSELFDEHVVSLLFVSKNLFAGVTESGLFKVISCSSMQEIFNTNLGVGVNDMVVAPFYTSPQVLIAAQDGTIKWVDILTKKSTTVVVSPKKSQWVERVCFFQEKGTQYFACSISKTIFLFKITGFMEASVEKTWNSHETTIRQLVYEPKTSRVVSFSNKQVFCWDINKDEPQETYIYDAIFSCGYVDVDMIIVGVRDGFVVSWDRSTSSKEASRIPLPERNQEPILFITPIGESIGIGFGGVIGTYSPSARAVKALQEENAFVQKGYAKGLNSYDIFQEKKWMATGGENGNGYVWKYGEPKAEYRLVLTQKNSQALDHILFVGAHSAVGCFANGVVSVWEWK